MVKLLISKLTLLFGSYLSLYYLLSVGKMSVLHTSLHVSFQFMRDLNRAMIVLLRGLFNNSEMEFQLIMNTFKNIGLVDNG